MTRTPLIARTVIVLFLGILLAPAAVAQEADRGKRRQSEKFAGPLREPPDRVADALHLEVEVSFDWEKEEVSGRATHTFRSFRDDLRSVPLDAVEIDAGKVMDPEQRPLGFETRPGKLVVHLGRPANRGEEFSFTIEYRCRPSQGVYFRKPLPGAPDIPMQIWTQGEANEARHWIPCFDHPSDKLTTEMIVTAPEGLTAISNGRLAEVREAPGGKGKVFHWKQEKPHVTYLIAVVVGKFAEYSDSWNGLPMTAYVPPERAADAARSFQLTADMMEYFTGKIGHAYPWAKYDQICVHEFLFGGMENTSATILTDRTLHDERAALDVDSMDLVAHELAHQWFGDLVTCKDWADIWLNESFATFFATLYRGRRLGWDEEVYDRKGQADEYLREDRNEYRRPLSTRRYQDPDNLFDAHSYPKGGRILAMLLHLLGEETFFGGIKLYLERHAFQPVETNDFIQAMEDASGRGLRWFFDQWVFSGGHPEYRVEYTWDEESRMVQVEVEQRQEVDETTPLFRMPVEIEVTTPAGKSLHRVEVAKKSERFSFPAAERPRLVRFDKHDWILKEIEFPKAREELLYQLEHDDAMMGRLYAARDLGKLTGDSRARSGLLRRLETEPFWGARVEIASALNGFRDREVRDGLIAAFRKEPKARVRQQILEALAEHPAPESAALARAAIAADPSYFTVAAGLRSLAKVESAAAAPELLAALDRDSHQDVIRTASVFALADLADKDLLGPKERDALIERLFALAGPGRQAFVRGSVLTALGRVGKENEKVFEFLAKAVEDPLVNVRVSVYEALGILGEARAIPVLEARRARENHRPFRDPLEAIDRAIRLIEGKDEKAARDEIRRLREAQERLEKRIEVLERRDGRGAGGARKF